MSRTLVFAVAIGAAVALAAGAPAQDPKTPPKKDPPASPSAQMPLELTGDLPDGAKAAAAPPGRVIATELGWVALQRAWGIKDPPKVDLSKQLLVVVTSRSDKVTFETKLDEKGDLRITALENKDERAGFRYRIKAIDRAGVKTVDGMPLPKE